MDEQNDSVCDRLSTSLHTVFVKNDAAMNLDEYDKLCSGMSKDDVSETDSYVDYLNYSSIPITEKQQMFDEHMVEMKKK